MNSRLMITCEDFSLEAEVMTGDEHKWAVVCHPHPLYGGDMNNEVVLTCASVFSERGFSVVRFNFRGVGLSGGSYGGGDGEVRDFSAVTSWVKNHDVRDLWYCGYSFGAWIILKAMCQDVPVPFPSGLVLISPPVDFLDFSGLYLPDVPVLITLGTKDQFCSVSSLKKWLGEAATRKKPKLEVKILDEVDHFYWNGLNMLRQALQGFL